MKMFSLILLLALILSCKSATTSTTSKTQDSQMMNNTTNKNISWISRGQLIYDFLTKYKNIKQLNIIWCYHKTNFQTKTQHENEKYEFYSRNVLKQNLQNKKQMVIPHPHDKEENVNQQEKQKMNFQTMNKTKNFSDIIMILGSLYENSGGVSIKVIPMNEILLSSLCNRNKITRTKRHCSNSNKVSSNYVKEEENNTKRNSNFEDIINKTGDLHQVIVLDMSCGNDSLQILQMASDRELFNSSYHWLLIEDYNNGINLKEKNNNNRTVDKIDDGEGYKYKQNIQFNKTNLIKFLSKLNINMNTELMLAVPSKKSIDQPDQEDYLLYDVWNPGWKFGGKLNVTKVGKFSQYNGLQMYDWFKRTTTIVRRMNMKYVAIRCMIVVTNKFSGILEDYLRNEREYYLDSMHHFNFALLNHVRDMFNFSFQVYRTNSWGYENNGTYDGMIGALVRGEIEIGGSPIFFLIERAHLIDYTAHTWTARPCFIFRHPDQIHHLRNIFLRPFSNDVWILLLTYGIMVITLLWCTSKIEESLYWILINGKKQFNRIDGSNFRKISWMTLPSSPFNRFIHYDDSNNTKKSCNPKIFRKFQIKFNHLFGDADQNAKTKFDGDTKKRRNDGFLKECILFFIGAVCQQGHSYRTYLYSGRCIVLSTLLFTFCMNQFYSASIVSTLIMEKPKTIKTLRTLIDSPLNIIIEDVLYNRDYFRRTTDPDAIELYRKKINISFKDNVKSIKLHENENKKLLDIENKKIKEMQNSLTAIVTVKETRNSDQIQRRSLKMSKFHWYKAEEGLKLMKTGDYAFHVDVATAYKIIKDTFTEREICELTEIQLFPPRKMVSIVRKGSPLRKMITYGLRRIQETGLMDRQRKLWHSQKPQCVRKIQPNDLKVGIQTFMSAVLILIFGLISSIVILFLEVMYDLWENSKNNR